MTRFVRTQEVEHEIGATGRFALRVTHPDVELRAAEGTVARARIQFELHADSEADADALFERVRYEVVPRTDGLEIHEPKRGGGAIGSIARMLGISGSVSDVSVVAEIPAGADVTAEGVSGDLDATGFVGRQQYRTVSGDFMLRELGGDVRVRGVSSDVTLRAVDTLRLELNTVSGDVSSFAPSYQSLRIVTVSGDVEVEGALPADAESRLETVSGDARLGVAGGVTIEVHALSSDVDISLPHRSEGTRDRRRFIIGDGAARVVFSSMSGDLVASRPRRAGPIPPTPPIPPIPPIPPTPAMPPTPPIPPMPATPPTRPTRTPTPDEQLEILRALERGEIDVDEAAAKLAGEDVDA